MGGIDALQMNFVEDDQGVFRLPFQASDVKVVIYPDKETKLLASNNEELQSYFSKYSPSTIVFEDCASF